jgi:antitoxin HigA-1
MVSRLEKGLGSSADTWLRRQVNRDLVQVRARSKSIKVARLVAA